MGHVVLAAVISVWFELGFVLPHIQKRYPQHQEEEHA